MTDHSHRRARRVAACPQPALPLLPRIITDTSCPDSRGSDDEISGRCGSGRRCGGFDRRSRHSAHGPRYGDIRGWARLRRESADAGPGRLSFQSRAARTLRLRQVSQDVGRVEGQRSGHRPQFRAAIALWDGQRHPLPLDPETMQRATPFDDLDRLELVKTFGEIAQGAYDYAAPAADGFCWSPQAASRQHDQNSDPPRHLCPCT